MKLKIPKEFDKWTDKIKCPKCKKKEVINYWHKNQKIIGGAFTFQCKSCFIKWKQE